MRWLLLNLCGCCCCVAWSRGMMECALGSLGFRCDCTMGGGGGSFNFGGGGGGGFFTRRGEILVVAAPTARPSGSTGVRISEPKSKASIGSCTCATFPWLRVLLLFGELQVSNLPIFGGGGCPAISVFLAVA